MKKLIIAVIGTFFSLATFGQPLKSYLSFGNANNGRNVLPYKSIFRGIAKQSSGKYIVVGDSIAGTKHYTRIWRFNVDGKEDTTFHGSNSFVGIPEGQVNDVQVRTDDLIYACGVVSSDIPQNGWIGRIGANGQPDQVFAYMSSNGTTGPSLLGAMYRLKLLDDNIIYVAGTSPNNNINNAVIIKLNYLFPYSSFGDGGFIKISNANPSISVNHSSSFYNLDLTPDGKVLACVASSLIKGCLLDLFPDGIVMELRIILSQLKIKIP